MGKQVDGNTRSELSGGAIAAWRRVKTPGALAYAGALEPGIGVAQNPAFASGKDVAVRGFYANGTFRMVAAGAFAKGAKLFGAADGKVDDVPNGNPVGIALEAATADLDEVEVLFIPQAGLSGLTVVGGQHTTVDADDTVVTGLAVVVAAVASFNDAPVEGAKFVSCTIGDQAGAPAAGSIQIKTHKDTDADAAIVDATTFNLKVNWIAFGY